VLQIGYVANSGNNLYSTIDLNQVNTALDDGSEQLGRPLTASCPAPIGLGTGGAPCYPYISFLNYLGNKSISNYQSLQATLTHRYSRGLYLLAGYTWAHAVDTAGNTNNLGYVPQDSFNYNYAAEKASGDYDIRHRFTLSATYDLPSRRGFGQLMEGWQVTSIVNWQTGMPVLLYDDYNDLTGTGEGQGMRIMIVGILRAIPITSSGRKALPYRLSIPAARFVSPWQRRRRCRKLWTTPATAMHRMESSFTPTPSTPSAIWGETFCAGRASSIGMLPSARSGA
jgi:hypothetical protein